MKKIKLITSLSSLAIVGASVPVIATSCKNDDNKNEYTINGLNWNTPPTKGITSSPNQWSVYKGDQFIASYDNCKNVKKLAKADSCAKELGFVYDETELVGSITPTATGLFKLAIDVTLTDDTKFTATTSVAVNTNYPWVVTEKDNCKASQQGKQVIITDITKAATLNVSMTDIPEGAEYVVTAVNLDGSEISKPITLVNNVLTIPANTFVSEENSPFITCGISVRNGISVIGNPLYLNITVASETEQKVEYGTVTLGTYDELYTWASTSHFPSTLTKPATITKDSHDEISQFINENMTAGMIAEATALYIVDSFMTENVDLLTDEFDVESRSEFQNCIIKWVTEGNTINVFAKSITHEYAGSDFVDYGVSTLNGTVTKDLKGKNVSYQLIVTYTKGDGESTTEYYTNSTGPKFIRAEYDVTGKYFSDLWLVQFNDAFGNGSFYLPIPYAEFTASKPGTGIELANSINNGNVYFETEEEIQEYAATAHFPYTGKDITINAKEGSQTFESDVSNLLSKTNINLGILADGLAYEMSYDLTFMHHDTHFTYGELAWQMSENGKRALLKYRLYADLNTGYTEQNVLGYCLTRYIDFSFDDNGKITLFETSGDYSDDWTPITWEKIPVSSAPTFDVWNNETSGAQGIMPVKNEQEQLMGYAIQFKDVNEDVTYNLFIPSSDYGDKLKVTFD